jgi:recombination protein RecT
MSYIATNSIQNAVKKLVGKDSQRFISAITSAVSTNSQLSECTNDSIFSGALLGESLKLSPSPQLGQYYLVPFNLYQGKDEKGKAIYKKVAQFQLGYKGYIQLAIRSGQYKDIDVIDVKDGEYLGRDQHTGKYIFNFIQDEDERDSKETIGYMAYFEYLNGFTKQLFWTKEQMEKHATKYSTAYASDKKNKTSYSFWTSNFDGMAFKTMLRQLISKWGIMSIEFQKAFESDMAMIENGKPKYVDNEDIIMSGMVEETIETKKVKLSEISNNK